MNHQVLPHVSIPDPYWNSDHPSTPTFQSPVPPTHNLNFSESASSSSPQLSTFSIIVIQPRKPYSTLKEYSYGSSYWLICHLNERFHSISKPTITLALQTGESVTDFSIQTIKLMTDISKLRKIEKETRLNISDIIVYEIQLPSPDEVLRCFPTSSTGRSPLSSPPKGFYHIKIHVRFPGLASGEEPLKMRRQSSNKRNEDERISLPNYSNKSAEVTPENYRRLLIILQGKFPNDPDFQELMEELDNPHPSNQSKRPRRGDIAYWHRRLYPDEIISTGDIVVLGSHGITKDLSVQGMISVVPPERLPWKICMLPPHQEIQNYNLVTYLGEVPVKVINPNDLSSECSYFVIACGNGYGRIISEHDFDDLVDKSKVLGLVVQREPIEGGMMNTLIGMNINTFGLDHLEVIMTENFEGLKLRVTGLESRMDCVEREVKLFAKSQQFDRMLGDIDPLHFPEIFVERTDERAKAIMAHIFPSPSTSSSSESTPIRSSSSASSSFRPMMTVIWGLKGIGKSYLARSILRKAVTDTRFKHVGYYDGNLPQHLPEESTLIIFATDDMRSIPMNRLSIGSHIIILTADTTLVTELESRGAVLFHLKRMNGADSRSLLNLCLPEFSNISERILSYAQGHPLILTLIAKHLKGNHIDDALNMLSNLEEGNQNADLTIKFSQLVWNIIRINFEDRERRLVYALSQLEHLRDSLPDKFIYHFWQRVETNNGGWCHAESKALLDKLESVGLLTYRDHYRLIPLCTELYPDPLRVIKMHSFVWDGLRGLGDNQPYIDLSQVIEGEIRCGKFDFLFGMNHEAEFYHHHHHDNPLLDFFNECYKGFTSGSNQEGSSFPSCSFDEPADDYHHLQSQERGESYLTFLQDDQWEHLSRWVISCLETHCFTQQPERNPKMKLPSNKDICLIWAQYIIDKIMESPQSRHAEQIFEWLLPRLNRFTLIFDREGQVCWCDPILILALYSAECTLQVTSIFEKEVNRMMIVPNELIPSFVELCHKYYNTHTKLPEFLQYIPLLQLLETIIDVSCADHDGHWEDSKCFNQLWNLIIISNDDVQRYLDIVSIPFKQRAPCMYAFGYFLKRHSDARLRGIPKRFKSNELPILTNDDDNFQ